MTQGRAMASLSPAPTAPRQGPASSAKVVMIGSLTGSLPRAGSSRTSKMGAGRAFSVAELTNQVSDTMGNSDFLHQNPSQKDLISRLKAKVVCLNEELSSLRHVDTINDQLRVEIGRLTVENSTLREAVQILTRRAKAEEDRKVHDATVMCELKRKAASSQQTALLRAHQEGGLSHLASRKSQSQASAMRAPSPFRGEIVSHAPPGSRHASPLVSVRSESPATVFARKRVETPTRLPDRLIPTSYQPQRRALSAQRRSPQPIQRSGSLSKVNDGGLASTSNELRVSLLMTLPKPGGNRAQSAGRSPSPLPIALSDVTAIPTAFKVPSYDVPAASPSARKSVESLGLSTSPYQAEEGAVRNTTPLSRAVLLPPPPARVTLVDHGRPTQPHSNKTALHSPTYHSDTESTVASSDDSTFGELVLHSEEHGSVQLVEVSAITDAGNQHHHSPPPNRSAASSAGNSPQTFGVHYVASPAKTTPFETARLSSQLPPLSGGAIINPSTPLPMDDIEHEDLVVFL